MLGVDDPNATRWCAIGAVMYAAAAHGHQPMFTGVVREVVHVTDAYARIAFPDECQNFVGSNTVHVNNRLGHDAILTVFDKTLADETVEA